jgi:hypothetical protein
MSISLTMQYKNIVKTMGNMKKEIKFHIKISKNILNRCPMLHRKIIASTTKFYQKFDKSQLI